MICFVSKIYLLKPRNGKSPPGYAIIDDYEFVNRSKATNGNVLRGQK